MKNLLLSLGLLAMLSACGPVITPPTRYELVENDGLHHNIKNTYEWDRSRGH